ncbi:ATP-binding protein [Vibrio parahaemolyticus]|uniref:AlbA family DNA-binding domain-containing protein n=1 Tax=Vibrio TaxID=662 RepID=UPI00146F69FC|nr:MULTISPECIES: ATP-binding protein [Vibrio]EIK0773730.1 ATP-binding protein [Vibrio alginolyticus]EKB1969615.1 ATP-binding protein [Vibrio parahaemolyticus]MDF5089492.1 ATP-binding protein [Vibrio parahaemolyticus]MDF5138050.1 ATP-binding protein [Vibrio parahaemolyticus]MDW2263968.1 ATP-binding protein [Vibrio sp. 1557]
MNSDIVKLLEQGESATIEFLLPEIDPMRLAKVIASFANSGGGKVLIGVQDSTFVPGIKIEEAQLLTLKVKELLSDPDIFEVENISFRVVLNICVITVHASSSLVLCNDGAYHRVNGRTKVMNRYEIQSKLSLDETALSKLSEVLETQTKKIDQLTADLNESNTLKSKLKDHLLGAIVGVVIGAIGAGIGL